MKYWNYLLVVLIVFASYSSHAQKSQGFELSGDILGLNDLTTVYLLKNNEGGSGIDTISKIKSRGSKFTFTGIVKGGANFYFIKLDSNVSKEFSNALWLMNKKLTVSGKLDDFRNLILKSSEAQDTWLAFKDLKGRTNPEQMTAMVDEFILSHLNSLFTPYIIVNSSNIEDMYLKLSEDAKNSFWGLKVKEKVNLTKYKKLPDFNVENIDGKIISIYQAIKNSKYTLIDIWASWCKPCREAIPEMKKVYDEFNKQGFNIIGVSIDKIAVDWKNAVKEDGSSWIHVLDQKGILKNTLGSVAVPSYILIDENGNIVQSELNSSIELTQKYPGKYFSHNLYEIIEMLFKEEKGK
ncbi:TlpA disulfide reductase family protein [Pedobacter frigoris]|uniref:TlpA disulfide reductase family protein n=1 Tax=Pedobacter frigoris TaxID=2571272 RepID=UPI002931E394|nr:TlpA disulfide reductase family protein [Pedobacter frigoris]